MEKMTVDDGETDEGSEEIQETKMTLVREAGLRMRVLSALASATSDLLLTFPSPK